MRMCGHGRKCALIVLLILLLLLLLVRLTRCKPPFSTPCRTFAEVLFYQQNDTQWFNQPDRDKEASKRGTV
jgi:hypothetical protein